LEGTSVGLRANTGPALWVVPDNSQHPVLVQENRACPARPCPCFQQRAAEEIPELLCTVPAAHCA